MWDWIINNNTSLKEQSKASAVTRAENSVVIIRKDARPCSLPVVKL